MTEEEWLACNRPDLMWRFLTHTAKLTRGKKGQRPFRLFACACCRAALDLLKDDRSRLAIEKAEMFVDGKITSVELGEARARAWTAYVDGVRQRKSQPSVDWESDNTFDLAEHMAGFVAHKEAKEACRQATGSMGWLVQKGKREPTFVCDVIRHIIGNPFRPYPAPDHWPSSVVRLAEAMYEGEGQDCAFALHDALHEAGNPDLAEHFRQEQHHPKGCWVVDLILGKS